MYIINFTQIHPAFLIIKLQSAIVKQVTLFNHGEELVLSDDDADDDDNDEDDDGGIIDSNNQMQVHNIFMIIRNIF